MRKVEHSFRRFLKFMTKLQTVHFMSPKKSNIIPTSTKWHKNKKPLYREEIFVQFQLNQVNYQLHQAIDVLKKERKKKASNQTYSHFCVDTKFGLTTNWFRAGDTMCIYMFVCVSLSLCACVSIYLIRLKVKRGHNFNLNLIYFSFGSRWDAAKRKTKTTGATFKCSSTSKKNPIKFLGGKHEQWSNCNK